MNKILVTPRSLSKNGHPALDDLRKAGYEVVFATPGKQPTEAELLAILPECVGYLAGVEPVSAKVLRSSPHLKVIGRNGVGIDNVDLEAAEEMGIAVERAVGANSRGVAELAISLMLSGVRSVPYSSKHLQAGEWVRRKGFEIEGKTLGLIGCGQIGKCVAKMALGLDMKVMAYDLYPDTTFTPSADFCFSSINDIFKQADVISLHCPPADKPLIDAEAIVRMKDGVIIVNTARAALVDDTALLAALKSGKLHGYATDVFHTEPPKASELLAHESVIATPHIGGFTTESVTRATQAAVDNILKIL